MFGFLKKNKKEKGNNIMPELTPEQIAENAKIEAEKEAKRLEDERLVAEKAEADKLEAEKLAAEKEVEVLKMNLISLMPNLMRK